MGTSERESTRDRTQSVLGHESALKKVNLSPRMCQSVQNKMLSQSSYEPSQSAHELCHISPRISKSGQQIRYFSSRMIQSAQDTCFVGDRMIQSEQDTCFLSGRMTQSEQDTCFLNGG